MTNLYYVFKCTRCGRWGVKQLRVELQHGTYTCRYEGCRKTSKMKRKNELGITMKHKGPYEKPMIAAEVCKILNGRRWEHDIKKNDNVVIYKSKNYK